eukprot:GHVS01045696.1.p1 GENE.GHVS01045696.1~~GHVS01045696.1.p1  ORF type:complete len:560 (+),score=109.93 GHVS01045696.1:49-1680(+)
MHAITAANRLFSSSSNPLSLHSSSFLSASLSLSPLSSRPLLPSSSVGFYHPPFHLHTSVRRSPALCYSFLPFPRLTYRHFSLSSDSAQPPPVQSAATTTATSSATDEPNRNSPNKHSVVVGSSSEVRQNWTGKTTEVVTHQEGPVAALNFAEDRLLDHSRYRNVALYEGGPVDRYLAPRDPSSLLIEPHKLTKQERIFQLIFAGLPLLSFLLLASVPILLLKWHLPKLEQKKNKFVEESHELCARLRLNKFRVISVNSLLDFVESQSSCVLILSYHHGDYLGSVYVAMMAELDRLFRRHRMPVQIVAIDLSDPLLDKQTDTTSPKNSPPSHPSSSSSGWLRSLGSAVGSPYLHLLVPFGMADGEPGIVEIATAGRRATADDTTTTGGYSGAAVGMGIGLTCVDILDEIARPLVNVYEEVFQDAQHIDEKLVSVQEGLFDHAFVRIEIPTTDGPLSTVRAWCRWAHDLWSNGSKPAAAAAATTSEGEEGSAATVVSGQAEDERSNDGSWEDEFGDFDRECIARGLDGALDVLARWEQRRRSTTI